MKRSRNAWSAAADEIFVEIWGDKIEELRGPRKNSHVHQEMAAMMQRKGYDVSPASVKTKIDNLTAKYRKCKAEIGTTGGSPAVWPLYDKIHQILGGFCINNVEELVEESFVEYSSECTSASSVDQSWSLSPSSTPLPTTALLPNTLPSSSSSAAPKSSAKRKETERLISVCEKMEENFEKAMTTFSESTEKLLELEKAKLLAMQEMQKDSKRLTDGVLDFLKNF